MTVDVRPFEVVLVSAQNGIPADWQFIGRRIACRTRSDVANRRRAAKNKSWSGSELVFYEQNGGGIPASSICGIADHLHGNFVCSREDKTAPAIIGLARIIVYRKVPVDRVHRSGRVPPGNV